MWLKILFSYFLLLIASTTDGLAGARMCQQEERYLMNETEYFTRIVTTRSYQWCLQVPPRCSVFSSKVINDSRIIEKEHVRFVDVCCQGFTFDQTSKTCIQDCGNCVHGICNEENKCYCDAGFRGDNCSRECESARWGRYCRYHCMCERGTCDSQTGICSCPLGWTGDRCETQCQAGYFGEQCKMECDCKQDEMCSSVDGNCSRNEITTIKPEVHTRLYSKKIIKVEPSLKKYHTFDLSTLKQNSVKIENVDKKVEIYILTTTELPITSTQQTPISSRTDSTTPVEDIVINLTTNINDEASTASPFKNYNKTLDKNVDEAIPILSTMSPEQTVLHTTMETLLTNDLISKATEDIIPITEVKTATPSYMSSYEDIKSEQEPPDVNIKSGDRPVHVQITKSHTLKGKVVSEVSGTRITLLPEETWLNDDSQLEVIHRDHSATNEGLEFSATRTATAVATLFLLITCLLVLVRIKKRSKTGATQCNETPNGVMSTVVTSRSIFHAPLPDPPIFENKICNAPLENNQTTIETQIIYSMNVRASAHNFANNDAELFYDHPPSTGSYRAASVPEPPDYKLLQISETNIEPLYDEIPCWSQPINEEADCDTLYMNTINENKTRF